MIAIPIPIDVPLRRDNDNVLRVGNTRVTLQTVITDFHKGASAEEIVHHYPALNLSDVYLLLGYYLQNRSEVDDYIRQQILLSDQIREQYEEIYPTNPLRTRLLKRLEEQRKTSP